MKILLTLLFCINISKNFCVDNDAGSNKSDLSKNAKLSMLPDALVSEIIPGFSSSSDHRNKKSSEYLSNFPNSPCKLPCDNQIPICPNYCNQTPQMCSFACQQQPTTVTIQVPVKTAKTVPQKITRYVQKQPRNEFVEIEIEFIRHCPKNYKMIEENQTCIVDFSTSCHSGYEFRNDRCVKTSMTCANECTEIMKNCVVKIVCPHNYVQHGNECKPPTPQCPFGWEWNGYVCKPQKLNCPPGYTLINNNQCILEVTKCRPFHREVGNECVIDEFECPFGYNVQKITNTCEQRVNKCPVGSFEQYGKCMKTVYECPVGSKDVGIYCTREEIIYKVVHEIKYVPQVVTLPGPVANDCKVYGHNGGYRCGSTCATNCISS